MYARGVLEDALKTSKNVGLKKKKKKKAVIFYNGPEKTCRILFCFVFVLLLLIAR